MFLARQFGNSNYRDVGSDQCVEAVWLWGLFHIAMSNYKFMVLYFGRGWI
ncbi:unnamed protein product [Meloidogyne enterolobii]|uniref:Uncharacterized protein n=1 Tax=Meloidogyne enterolobii TaxID=390850 RepID=A0ACB0YIN3_MELEN